MMDGISEPETVNLINFFSQTVQNTRSENQDFIRSYISTIEQIFAGVCISYNSEYGRMSAEYRSCNFSDPCVLAKKLKNMNLNADAMIEMQYLYDEQFTPFSAFELALDGGARPTLNLSVVRNTKLKSLEQTLERLPVFHMVTRKSDVSIEVKEIYDILKGYTKSYSECLTHFPDLMRNDSNLLIITPNPRTRKHWNSHNLLLYTESNDVPIIVITRRVLIRLFLLFSLNNSLVLFFNSNIASLINGFILNITVCWIFCFHPIVPFSIAFTEEVLNHHAYRKVSGCICKIKKKLPIMKEIKKYKVQKEIKKFKMQLQSRVVNIRMYKHRMRKLQLSQSQ